MRTTTRTLATVGTLVLAVAGGTGTAAAHVQVQPTTVAPNDPVEFQVVVPSERPAHTTKVDLKLPAGVIPFAYGDTPGWRRRLVTASNGAVERLVWTGKLAEDGYVRFTFLAGTPEKPTSLTWKALQTYDDGTVARWIGSPSSESPAPVTRVVAGAPRRNAGGEGDDARATGAGSTDAAAPVRTAAAAPASSGGDDQDWVARGLGIAAVLVALAGAGVAVRGRRST